MKLYTVKTYHENGKIYQEYTVNEHCHIHGTYRDWYDNGPLYSQCEYVNGELHGIQYIWNEDGSLLHVEQYDTGNLLVEVNYRTNPIKIRMIDPNIESSGFIAEVTSSLDCEGKKYEFTNS